MAKLSDTDRELGEKLTRGRRGADIAPPSQRKIGKYEIARKLGSGGMGDVFLAIDPDLGREVAIKVINLPISISTPEAMRTLSDRFRLEARSAAKVAHPNVVTIYEFSEMAGKHLLVMEYIHGRTLKELIEGGKALPPVQAARLAIDVLDGLAAIHKAGMIHRDVKPMNLMLTSQGRVKILDFGLVKDTLQPSDLTQVGIVAGSPSYMAPEQTGLVTGKVDARSDLYALGVVLFQLLTGHLPFSGNNLIETLRQHCQVPVPPVATPWGPAPFEMVEIVRKAMSKKPDERFASAEEMREALLRFTESKPAISGLSKTLPAHEATPPAVSRTMTPSGVRTLRRLAPVAANATSSQRPRSPSVPPPIPARAPKPSVPSPSPPATPIQASKRSWSWTLLGFVSAIGFLVVWLYVTGRTPWSARASQARTGLAGSAAATLATDASVPVVVPTADDGCKAYEEMKLGRAIEILKPLDVGAMSAEQLFCLCASEHALGHVDEQKDCRLYLKHPLRDRGKARQVEHWLSKPGTH